MRFPQNHPDFAADAGQRGGGRGREARIFAGLRSGGPD
jgi:hypothetical protein